MSLPCGTVCGGGVREGTLPLAQLLTGFLSLLPLPTANWALLVLIPGWVGLCMFQDPVGLSNELSCRLGVSPTAISTPTGVFSQRFEALFPHAGALGCVVCLAPQFFLPVYLSVNVGPPGPLWPGCPTGLDECLSPTGLDECFSPWLLDFHTVRFSGSSGCFLFLNLLLSFFWLFEEAYCIYQVFHLGWKSIAFVF